MMERASYTQQDLERAIRDVGVQRGDLVFSHVGLGLLGFPNGQRDPQLANDLLFGAMTTVLGPEGTWLIPTYSYTYCKGELFDLQSTPSDVGGFTECFRALPGVVRSIDPIFSVAGLGPRTEELFADLPHDCFGGDCLYARLVCARAKLCNFGVGFRYATFIHHVEQMMRVPYRYPKLFKGVTRFQDRDEEQTWLYNVRVLSGNGFPDLRRLEDLADERGLIRAANVGLGEATCIRFDELWDICTEGVRKDPWFMAEGPAADLVEAERRRIPAVTHSCSIADARSLAGIVSRLAELPREHLSDGSDAAMDAVAEVMPLKRHRLLTGSRVAGKIVPERWVCRGGRVEALDGRVVLDYAENPLHVVGHSLAVDAEVTRQALFERLAVGELPGAIPYRSHWEDREWGFACTPEQYAGLTEPAYRVKIDSDFAYGQLTIGEALVPGRGPGEVLLAAHLGHPGQSDCGLSGLAVCMDLMREMHGMRPPVGVRLLIYPEPLGWPAISEHVPQLLTQARLIVFVDLLGRDAPLTVQWLRRGDDEIAALAGLRELPYVVPAGHAEVDGAALPCPTLRLSRCSGDPAAPYHGHHTSLDCVDAIREESLVQARDLLRSLIYQRGTSIP